MATVVVVGSLARWMITRQLKQVSTQLKRAEGDLRIEREQVLAFTHDAADAEGEHLTIGNGATRDEAFRANQHLQKSQSRIIELDESVAKLRIKQDELLDRLGSQ